MALRIVLMGTGEFAIPPFRAVLQSQHSVVGVVTQPDRTGRGHHRHVNAVKEMALERQVPVLQPERVNRPEVLKQLQAWDADLFLVAAYGQILKPSLLRIPRLGAFNLHGSLLPRHRGAAPVQYAVWKGDLQTGVTIFQIEPALDSGPVIGHVATPVGPHETSGELMLRLAELSVPLTLSCCDALEAGTARFSAQDESQVTLAPRLQKEQGVIDWQQTAREIDCQVRAMQPWPRASSWLCSGQPGSNLRCLILRVGVITANEAVDQNLSQSGETSDFRHEAGEIHVRGGRLFVACGKPLHGMEWLEVVTIQPEGKRPMDAAALCHGYKIQDGAKFVSEPGG